MPVISPGIIQIRKGGKAGSKIYCDKEAIFQLIWGGLINGGLITGILRYQNTEKACEDHCVHVLKYEKLTPAERMKPLTSPIKIGVLDRDLF